MDPVRVATWNRARRDAGGQPTALTFEWPMTDRPHQFEARLIPEPSADGAITTVLAITRDVTVELRGPACRLRREGPRQRPGPGRVGRRHQPRRHGEQAGGGRARGAVPLGRGQRPGSASRMP